MALLVFGDDGISDLLGNFAGGLSGSGKELGLDFFDEGETGEVREVLVGLLERDVLLNLEHKIDYCLNFVELNSFYLI